MPKAARKTAPASGDWISLVEAARLLDEARQTVLTRAIKGEIEAKHIAGRTVVSRADVERARAKK